MSDITTEIKENNKNEPCGICGENHLLENCSLITIKYHVYNYNTGFCSFSFNNP